MCSSSESNAAQMSAFFEGTGPPKIIFYYQVPEVFNAEGEFVRQGEIPKLSLNTSDVSDGPLLGSLP